MGGIPDLLLRATLYHQPELLMAIVSPGPCLRVLTVLYLPTPIVRSSSLYLGLPFACILSEAPILVWKQDMPANELV
jgi:hypothetical protein